jgi:hypothetical protein
VENVSREASFQRYKIIFLISLFVPLCLYYTAYGKGFLFERGAILSLLIYSLIYYFGVFKNHSFARFAMKLFIWLHALAIATLIGFIAFN